LMSSNLSMSSCLLSCSVAFEASLKTLNTDASWIEAIKSYYNICTTCPRRRLSECV
jgi:hypothetical protein